MMHGSEPIDVGTVATTADASAASSSDTQAAAELPLSDDAQAKLAAKKCDLIVANDVSPGTATFGGDANRVWLVEKNEVTEWPPLSKKDVAARLALALSERLS